MRHGYIGNDESVPKAIVEWSSAYADKSLDDFINSGDAETGVGSREEDRHR